VRKAAAIGCSRLLQRPHGNLLNRQENATCIWTCGQGSVRRRNVARTTGQLPHRQTCHSCTYCSSGHQRIHLKYLPIGESLCGNLRRTNHSVPQAKKSVTDLWGEQVAQVLHNRRGVVLKCDFPFVYREGMERVMKSFPEMFRVWVTKMSPTFKGKIVSSRLYPSQLRMFAQVVAAMMRQLHTSLAVKIQAIHNYSPSQWSNLFSGWWISKQTEK
jgi:hypothetical protein